MNIFSKYKQDLIALFTGSSFVSLFPFLTIPVLTRFYSVENFGQYELFYSIVGIVSIIPNLRLENVILIEHNSQKINNVYQICLFLNLFFFTIGFLCLSFSLITGMIYLKIVSLGVISGVFFSLFNLNNQFYIRHKLFKKISFNNAFSTINKFIFSILLLNFSFNGLVLGTIVSQFFTLILSFFFIRNHIPKITFSGIYGKVRLLHEHKNFIVYTFPGDFVNNIAQQIPTFFIQVLFGSKYLGLYGMSKRLLITPLGVLSMVFQDLYKKLLVDEKNASGRGDKTFFYFLKIFSVISVTGITIVFLFSEMIIRIILGVEWSNLFPAFYYLSLFAFIKFISGGINYCLLVFDKQKLDFILQISLLATTILSVLCCLILGLDYSKSMMVYSIAMIINYLYILKKCYYVTK